MKGRKMEEQFKILRIGIAAACKRNDELFMSQLGFLAMAVEKPFDMIDCMIRKYTQDQDQEIVNNLEKFKIHVNSNYTWGK